MFVPLSDDDYRVSVYMYKCGGTITTASSSICTHTQFN